MLKVTVADVVPSFKTSAQVPAKGPVPAYSAHNWSLVSKAIVKLPEIVPFFCSEIYTVE